MQNNISNKGVVVSILLVILLIGTFFYFYKNNNTVLVSSFEECKKAGYPILESYPEQCRTPDGKSFINSTQVVATSTIPTATTTTILGNDEIKIYKLTSGQTITSQTTIEGEAKGWYFEASFPVELVDANGKILFQGPATAQKDWMTSAFVPFKITVSFANPTTATGTLIFRNDNPSGLPENEKSFRVPVSFKLN